LITYHMQHVCVCTQCSGKGTIIFFIYLQLRYSGGYLLNKAATNVKILIAVNR